MPDKKLILLGHVAGAHGIRGELLIKSYTAAPEDIAAYGALTDASGRKSFKLKIVRVTPKGVIVRIVGVADRNAAEALKGTGLHVDRAAMGEPEAGEYFYSDLIGLGAVAPDGAPIGTIKSVQNFGAGDLLEISLHRFGQDRIRRLHRRQRADRRHRRRPRRRDCPHRRRQQARGRAERIRRVGWVLMSALSTCRRASFSACAAVSSIDVQGRRQGEWTTVDPALIRGFYTA